MKKGIRRCIMAGAVVFTLMNVTNVAHATTVKDAEAQKKQLEQEQKEIEQQLAALEKEKGDTETYIKKLDTQLNQLIEKLDTTESNLNKTQEELDQAKFELVTAEETQINQYDTMKARIKYMYENGSQDYYSLLTSASSLTELLNRTEYISKISEYDQGLFTRYDETTKLIAVKKAEIEVNLAQLTVLKEKLELEKASVNKLVEDKNTELKKYEVQIASSETQISNYDLEIDKQEQLIEQIMEQERIAFEKEQKRLEELRRQEEEKKRQEEEEQKRKEELANQATAKPTATPTPSSSPSGGGTITSPLGLRWPLNIPGKVTSTFGPRPAPTAGASTNHLGIDISAAYGTPIIAAGSGTVVTAKYSSGAGNYVQIYHGNGIYTTYMHNASLKVSAGDYVNQGDQIATMGSTGTSTGTHLDFRILVNGTYVDPLKYVSP